MQPGSVALVLVQPGNALEAWSSASLLDRMRSAMFRRQQDVYLRPLLEAPTLSALTWRATTLHWRFALESRTTSLGFFLLSRKLGEKPLSREQIGEAYAFLQERLAATSFSEETTTNIDYTIYTAFRAAQAAVEVNPSMVRDANPSARHLANLIGIASKFELYMHASFLAVMEPALVKNPLVLRELAHSGAKSADAYVAALSEVGISVA